ncbi:hypothetical protein VNO80_08156 [Phaseolus coccineus]|uniref:Uncharacterized protein n=1 Tax=Phaseolus coccineus TaxID=3886 RepID=A0AAN9RKA0_PHACN
MKIEKEASKRCVIRKGRKTLNLIDSVQLLKAFTVRSLSPSSFFNSSPKLVSPVDSAHLCLCIQGFGSEDIIGVICYFLFNPTYL